METDGVNVWLEKKLKPLSKSMEKVPPEVFAWLSLAFSGGAGVLLYLAQAQYWPIAALPAGFILLLRLLSDSLENTLCAQAEPLKVNHLSIKLLARLSDLSMLLGFAFWDSLRIHLVLMAIVSMLLVSYIAEVGRSLGVQNNVAGGLLSKTNRIILLVFFCFVYLLKPNARISDYSVFEVMFALFIPLASITMLQRMDSVISQLRKK